MYSEERQCTARCLQRVAPQIIGVYTLYIIGVFCGCYSSMRTNSRMSLGHTLQATCGTLPSNENELLTRHLAMRTNSLLTRQLSNKYKLPTHTLQARCGTFTLLPILASTIEPAAAGCVETRSQSDPHISPRKPVAELHVVG